MQENLKDILSHLTTDIDQETLLLYLQDKLPDEKKHAVGKTLAENEFANDALEGLQQVKDKKQIAFMVDMLNRDLKKKVEKKKQRREKMKTERSALVIHGHFHFYHIDRSLLYDHSTHAATLIMPCPCRNLFFPRCKKSVTFNVNQFLLFK